MFVSRNQRIGARAERGDTMIEVLVTIIIMAVGVLGTAALQVTTLKNLSSSHSASIAAIVADDFSNRMRGNADAAVNYLHNAKPDAFPDCAINACNDTQMANYDIGTWWDDMNMVLPRSRASVTRNPGTDTYVITVQWDEDRSGSNGTACPPQSDADLECYQLEVTLQ